MGLFRKRENYDYFSAFSAMAADASAAAVLLDETFTQFRCEKLQNYVKQMHEIETHADTLKHTIVRNLAHAFITPIEREDIVVLTQNLDTVVDSIDEVLHRLYMYDIRAIRPEALSFTRMIADCCKALEDAVKAFRGFKTSESVHTQLIRVNTFESKGDELHLNYLHRLFHENNETKMTLAWAAVFEILEQCCDACENAADTMEGIIMKNT